MERGGAHGDVTATMVAVATSTVVASTRNKDGNQRKIHSASAASVSISATTATTATTAKRVNVSAVARATCAGCQLMHIKDGVPAHVPDNPFILTGYRPPLTLVGCLRSMVQWHNQTLNMWTALVLMWLNLVLAAHYADATLPAFQTAFWVHGTLRALCWMHSWLYHTFVSYPSRNLANILCTLDYIGCYLTPLGIASNVVYVELHRYPLLRTTIIVVGTLGILAAMLLATLPMYQTEAYRRLRVRLSIACTAPHVMGVLLAIVLVHDWRVPSYYCYLGYAIAWELAGAAAYVSMLPEKIMPQTFDTWLNSHILWHCFNFGFDFYMMYFVYLGALHMGEAQQEGHTY